MISNITPLAWRGHLDSQVDVELFDLHDRCYARQAVMDNAVIQRARELLKVANQMKGESAMADFNNNLTVNVLCQKIKSLSGEKFIALEAEKSRLEATKATLRQEVESIKGIERRHERALQLGKGERLLPSYKKEHTKAGNDLTTATFPFLSEVLANLSASVEALLSKKPKSLCCPTPTKTYVPAPSAPSQKATPSSSPVSKSMSPPHVV
ncbi:hypothetical protein Tco_1546280 [Tanacetum coccineum]